MVRRTLLLAYRDTALCKRQEDSANAIIVIVRIFIINLSYFDQKQLPRFWLASRLQRAVVPGFTDFHNPAHGINAKPLTVQRDVLIQPLRLSFPVFGEKNQRILENLIGFPQLHVILYQPALVLGKRRVTANAAADEGVMLN
jgi:hypothetical protein